MKWEGAKEFADALKGASDIMQQAAAREIFTAAKDMRDEMLEGFNIFGIRMVTGRSRALVAAKPGRGLFSRGERFVLSAEAGYLNWPKEGDAKSGGEPIAFYPYYLNYGTETMPMRPFYTRAVDLIDNSLTERMSRAMAEAMNRYARGVYGK